MASSVVQTAGDLASTYGHQAAEAATAISKEAGHLASAAEQRMVEEISGLIRRKPIPAMLVAFGLGCLFARLVWKANYGN
jgi:hypothetical protein